MSKQSIIIATGMDNTALGGAIRNLVGQVQNAGKEIERGFMPESMTGELVNYYRKAGKSAGRAFKEGAAETKGEAGIGGMGMGKEFLAFGGITLGAEEIHRLTERAAAIRRQQSTTGLGAETLQRTERAGSLLGIDPDHMASVLEKLNVQIGEAASGSAQAQAHFEKWGIGIDGKTNEQIFAEIANKMAALPDPAARAAMAVDLMGKSGKDLVPLLEKGAKAMQQMGSHGPIMSESDIEALELAHKSMVGLFDYIEIGLAKLFGALYRFWGPVAEAIGNAYSAIFDKPGHQVELTDKGKAAYDTYLKTHGIAPAEKEKKEDPVNHESHPLFAKFKARMKSQNDASKGVHKEIDRQNKEHIKAAEAVAKINKEASEEQLKAYRATLPLSERIKSLESERHDLEEKRNTLKKGSIEYAKNEYDISKLTLEINQDQNDLDKQKKEHQKQLDSDIVKLQELRGKQKKQEEEGTHLTLGQIAGTRYERQLEKEYGKGGRFDLGAAGGNGSSEAQELLRLQYAIKYDRKFGSSQNVDWDLNRMKELRASLVSQGQMPDNESAKVTADEITKVSDNIRDLVKGGAVIKTELATRT